MAFNVPRPPNPAELLGFIHPPTPPAKPPLKAVPAALPPTAAANPAAPSAAPKFQVTQKEKTPIETSAPRKSEAPEIPKDFVKEVADEEIKPSTCPPDVEYLYSTEESAENPEDLPPESPFDDDVESKPIHALPLHAPPVKDVAEQNEVPPIVEPVPVFPAEAFPTPVAENNPSSAAPPPPSSTASSKLKKNYNRNPQLRVRLPYALVERWQQLETGPRASTFALLLRCFDEAITPGELNDLRCSLQKLETLLKSGTIQHPDISKLLSKCSRLLYHHE